MDKVRLALIGFGKWGRNYVQAARDAGNAEVTHIVDRRGPPHDLASRVLWTRDYLEAQMLGLTKDTDAIIYAGRPSGVVDVCEQTREEKPSISSEPSGKPILIEKPAGLSFADAQRVERATESRLCLIGHQHLFSEAFDELHNLNPRESLHAMWCGPGPERDYSALWDYGPHAVASILAVRGRDPIHVQGYASGGGYTIRMVFDDGTTDHVAVSARTATKAARLNTVRNKWSLTLYDGYAPVAEPPLTRQVRAFADAVRAGGTNDWRFGGRWATRVASVLDRAERTAHPPV